MGSLDLATGAVVMGSLAIGLIVLALLGGSWILFNQRNGLFAQISDLSANSTTSCDICNYNVLDSKGDPIPGVYGFNSVYNTYKNDVGGGFYPDNAKSKPQLILEGVSGGTADDPGFTQLSVMGDTTLKGTTTIGTVSSTTSTTSEESLNVSVPTYLFDSLHVYSTDTGTGGEELLSVSTTDQTMTAKNMSIAGTLDAKDAVIDSGGSMTVGACDSDTDCTILKAGTFCVGNCDENAACNDKSNCSTYTPSGFTTANMSVANSLTVDGTDIVDAFDNLSSLQTGFEMWSCLGTDENNNELCYPIVPSLTNFTNRVEAQTSINSASNDSLLPGTTRNADDATSDLAGWGSNSSNPKIMCSPGANGGGGCIVSSASGWDGSSVWGGIYKNDSSDSELLNTGNYSICRGGMGVKWIGDASHSPGTLTDSAVGTTCTPTNGNTYALNLQDPSVNLNDTSSNIHMACVDNQNKYVTVWPPPASHAPTDDLAWYPFPKNNGNVCASSGGCDDLDLEFGQIYTTKDPSSTIICYNPDYFYQGDAGRMQFAGNFHPSSTTNYDYESTDSVLRFIQSNDVDALSKCTQDGMIFTSANALDGCGATVTWHAGVASMLYDSDVAVTPCFKGTENCVVAESGDLKGTDPLLGLRIGVTAKQSAADGLTTASGSVSPEEKATGMLFNGYCTGQASSVNPVLAPPTVQWPYPCLTNSSGGPVSGGVDACVGETLTMSVGDPGWQFSDTNDALVPAPCTPQPSADGSLRLPAHCYSRFKMVKPATTASSITSTESNAPTVSSAYAKYLTCCGSTVANTVTDPAWGCADVDCTSLPPASTASSSLSSSLSAPSRRSRRGRASRRGRRRRSPTTSRSYPRDNVRLSSINSITEDSLFQNLPSSWRAVSCGPRSACSNDMYVANVNSGAMLRVPCCNNYTDKSSCSADDQCIWNDASDVCSDTSGNFSNEDYCNSDLSPTERMESLRDALLETPSDFSTIPHAPQFLSGQLNLPLDAETKDITYSCDGDTDVQIFVDPSCNAQSTQETLPKERCKFWSCAKSNHSTSPVLAINSSGEPYTTTAAEWNVPLCSFSKASNSPYSETDKEICTWNSRVSPARNFGYVTMNPCFYNPALDAGIRASSNTTAYPKCYDTVRDFWKGVVEDCDSKKWDSLPCRQLALAASTSTDSESGSNYGSKGVCGTGDGDGYGGETSIAEACSQLDQRENLVDFFAGTATTLAPMAWSTYWTNASGQTIDEVAGGYEADDVTPICPRPTYFQAPPEDKTCKQFSTKWAIPIFDALPEVCDDGSENCVTYDDHLKDLATSCDTYTDSSDCTAASQCVWNDGSGTCTDVDADAALEFIYQYYANDNPVCSEGKNACYTAGYCNGQTKQKQWNDQDCNCSHAKKKSNCSKNEMYTPFVWDGRTYDDVSGALQTESWKDDHCFNLSKCHCTFTDDTCSKKFSSTSCSSTSYTKERCSSNQKNNTACYKRVVESSLAYCAYADPDADGSGGCPGAHSSLVFRGGEASNAMARCAPKGTGTGTDSNNKLAYCVVDAVSADLGIPGSTPSTTAPIPVDTDSDTAVAVCTTAAQENLLGAPAEQAAISTTLSSICATAKGTACIETNATTWEEGRSPMGWQSVSCGESKGKCSPKNPGDCDDISAHAQTFGVDPCQKRGLDAASGGECTHLCKSGCGPNKSISTALAYADYCDVVYT